MTEQERNQLLRERLDAMQTAPPLGNAVMVHIDWISRMEGEIYKRDAVLRKALEALENCYNVTDHPADGDTDQDRAIAAIKGVLND